MNPDESSLIQASFDQIYLLAQESDPTWKEFIEIERLKREFSKACNSCDTAKMTELAYRLTEFAPCIFIRDSFFRFYRLARHSSSTPRDRTEVERLKREFSEAYNFRDIEKMKTLIHQLTEFTPCL